MKLEKCVKLSNGAHQIPNKIVGISKLIIMMAGKTPTFIGGKLEGVASRYIFFTTRA